MCAPKISKGRNRDWLEKADDLDIWTAHRYISALASDGSTMRIPTLTDMRNGEEVTASTNEDKSQMLARTFFPSKPSENKQSECKQNYPAPVCKMDNITCNQIRRHLAKLKLYKASGPDNIPNIRGAQSCHLFYNYFLLNRFLLPN